jgi:predicted HTH domain antitoxin
MKDVTLTLPGAALQRAKIPRQRLQRELKKELALQLYREGLIAGFGACSLADIEKADFQDLLGQRGIPQQYDVEDYEQDLENLAAWRTEK